MTECLVLCVSVCKWLDKRFVFGFIIVFVCLSKSELVFLCLPMCICVYLCAGKCANICNTVSTYVCLFV